MFIRLSGSEALDGHAAVPFVVFENAHGCQTNGTSSRNRAEGVRQLGIENPQAFRSVTVERRVDLEGNEPFRRKAGAEITQVCKAADEKTGANQEQERKSHLHDDKAFSQSMIAAATHDGTGLVF